MDFRDKAHQLSSSVLFIARAKQSPWEGHVKNHNPCSWGAGRKAIPLFHDCAISDSIKNAEDYSAPAERVRLSSHLVHRFWTHKAKWKSTATLTRTSICYVAWQCFFPSNACSSCTIHYGIFLTNYHNNSDMPSLVISREDTFCLSLCDFIALHYRIPLIIQNIKEIWIRPTWPLSSLSWHLLLVPVLSSTEYHYHSHQTKINSATLYRYCSPATQERKGYSNHTMSQKRAPSLYSVHANMKTSCA